MTNPSTTHFPKELSWLSFNERVLQEAADKENPIVERIRFLGIFSNNLDEFYRVRVADVKRQIYIYANEGNTKQEAETRLLMDKIQKKVVKLTKRFDLVYQEVVRGLARYNIFLIDRERLTPFQTEWLKEYFATHVLKHIAPIMLHAKVDLVKRLNDTSAYFYVAIHRKNKNTRHAVVEIPAENVPRFVVIPPEKSKKKKHIILLDDIIELCLENIFKGFVEFDSLEAYSFKLTRDAEYSLNDEIDESFVEKMSESMKQRLSAEPVRIIYDDAMPEEMVKTLGKRLKLSALDVMIGSGPIRNFKDFIGFPNVGREYLEHPALPPFASKDFAAFDTVFDAISHRDILLYYPYHRFLHMTEFLRQAAFDPRVKAIRINLYRLARNSRIISSLIDAVDNGKSVTVVVELQARFDEQANIKWSKVMKDAGIRVFLGVPTLKIHSKLCIVTREERGELVNYAHFGTGNFNEKTAEIYTDFSLFTRHTELAREAMNVFDFILYPYRRHRFDHLQVSPTNARTKIQFLIRREIKHKRHGKASGITLKVNNLVDQHLVEELYKASQAGVKVKAIVRGMCSLVPGVKGLSDNISVISIADRFLEHPRVAVFENGGDRKVFISSADWMTRNMDNRIEVGCPIYDPELQTRILHILALHFKDTMKARRVDADQSNSYVPRGNRRKLRSQVEIYNYLKKLEMEPAVQQAK